MAKEIILEEDRNNSDHPENTLKVQCTPNATSPPSCKPYSENLTYGVIQCQEIGETYHMEDLRTVIPPIILNHQTITTMDQDIEMNTPTNESGQKFLINEICSSSLNTPDINVSGFNFNSKFIPKQKNHYSLNADVHDAPTLMTDEEDTDTKLVCSDRFDKSTTILPFPLFDENMINSMENNSTYESKTFCENMSILEKFIDGGNRNVNETLNSKINIGNDNFIFENINNKRENQMEVNHSTRQVPSDTSDGCTHTSLFPYETNIDTERNMATPPYANQLNPDQSDPLFSAISVEDLSFLNSCLAEKEGNILAQAINDISPKESEEVDTDEKVNSFLNHGQMQDPAPCPPIRDTPNFQNSFLKHETPNYQSNSFNNIRILKSFESSFGKECKPILIENVKIVIPSKTEIQTQHQRHSESYEGTQDIVVKYSLNSTDIKQSNSHNISTISQLPVPARTKTPEPSTSKGERSKSRETKRKIKPTSKYLEAQKDASDEETEVVIHSNKKKGKLSLKGLSDAEKYRRIREQNNIASRKCREKKKEEMKEFSQILSLLEQEKKEKEEIVSTLTKEVENWKQLINPFKKK